MSDGVEPDQDTDWFGFALERPRAPVPCPRCSAPFTDRDAYATHLRVEHAMTGTGRPPDGRGSRPALGRNRSSPLAQRLRTVPLVLVVVVNVAGILVALGAMAAVGPDWWDRLVDRPWGRFVMVPLLWPTVGFLAVRGLD